MAAVEGLIVRRNAERELLREKVNENLERLMDRTGYQMVRYNGQRIYSAPATCSSPPKGCEIFIGKLPRDMFEDELVPILEMAGPIYRLRLMMEFSGLNRGYCFVTYYKEDVAKTAISLLHDHQVRPGRHIYAYKSVDNCRLFVGGLPLDRTKEDIFAQLKAFVDGIVAIIMYPSHANKKLNRGFVFVEFEDHRTAAMARRKLSPGSLVLWGVPIMVDWADPLPEVDSSVMSRVTKLYLRNLDINLTSRDLLDYLQRFTIADNIIKVHKTLDYAFVHLVSRQIAEDMLQLLTNATIDGVPFEVTWARPRMFSKSQRATRLPEHYCMSLPPRIRRQVQTKRNLQQTVLRQPPVTHMSELSPNVWDGSLSGSPINHHVRYEEQQLNYTHNLSNGYEYFPIP